MKQNKKPPTIMVRKCQKIKSMKGNLALLAVENSIVLSKYQ